MLLYLDFEKAFDSLDWKFMTKALYKIQGDGQKFLDRFESYFGSQISSQSLN